MAGDGWGNPVIGGADTLIRRAMKSPNFVAGSAGWSVNKDGTAEFSAATIRGSLVIGATDNALLLYEGTPANGTLSASLSASSVEELDAYGNRYPPGLCLHSPNGTTASLAFLDPVTNVQHASLLFDIFLNSITLSHDGGGDVHIATPGGEVAVNAHSFVVNNDNAGWVGVRIGNGVEGGCTTRDSTFSKSIPNNAVTALTALATVLQTTDYAGEWGGAVFTAPVTGFYDVSLYANSPGGLTDLRCAVRLNGVNIAEDQTNVAAADVSCSYTALGMTVGQTLDAVLLQQNGTAVNKTITGRFSVSRRIM